MIGCEEMNSKPISLGEPLKVAGVLCIVAPLQWFILVFVAQAYYPRYSMTKNDLSDLGATCHNAVGPTPDVCTIYQTASIIWNVTLSLFGLLTVLAAYFIYRGLKNRLFCTFLGLFGLGALMAGVVPENVNLTAHGLGALVSFVAGGAAAITVYRLRLTTSRLFTIASIILGTISIAGLILLIFVPFATLESSAIGHGGDERIIVYPLYIWEMILGAVLLWGKRTTTVSGNLPAQYPQDSIP
jgi:hypothetical membrane protein